MSYSDPEQQRRYQRERLARIRMEWLDAHGPCSVCGSAERLEVDHVDPSLKVSHNVWSWSPSRREEELAKCQVLCHECHLQKTADWRRSFVDHGTDTMYSKFGCRCDSCVGARRVAKAANRKRRKELGLPYQ